MKRKMKMSYKDHDDDDDDEESKIQQGNTLHSIFSSFAFNWNGPMEISLGMWIDAKHIIQMRQSLCILNVLRMLIDWERAREESSGKAHMLNVMWIASQQRKWSQEMCVEHTHIRYAPDTLEFSHRAALHYFEKKKKKKKHAPSESLSRIEQHNI